MILVAVILLYAYASLLLGFMLWCMSRGLSPLWRWCLFWPISVLVIFTKENSRLDDIIRKLILGKP